MNELTPPDLPYRPPTVENPPTIALVGCGEITAHHLDAYTAAGYDVTAFCDIEEAAARTRRDEYYPDADVYTDASEVFDRDDVEVVDIATHPEPRESLIEQAIEAGKHVLSQKPFALDLDAGERLVELADDRDVRLAVNQNGRWSPHWSYARHAVQEGYLGDVFAVHLADHWNHDPIASSSFDHVRHAILYDYAIHHFDFLATVLPNRDPEAVFATIARSPTQEASPPLLGETIVSYDGGHASLVFDGHVEQGGTARTYVAGSSGTLESTGQSLQDQTVTLHTAEGSASPDLEGQWFPDGFHGSMAELMSAIRQDCEPANSARDNLRSLELCYAAVASAEDGVPKVPGEVRSLRRGDPGEL